jgi:hypothetical protein
MDGLDVTKSPQIERLRSVPELADIKPIDVEIKVLLP